MFSSNEKMKTARDKKAWQSKIENLADHYFPNPKPGNMSICKRSTARDSPFYKLFDDVWGCRLCMEILKKADEL